VCSHGHRGLAGTIRVPCHIPLVGENRAHVVDGGESVWVVLSECVLTAIEGSLVPFKCLAILPLVEDNQAHVVDGAESGRVVLSECVFKAIEGSLVPFECLAILSLIVENHCHVLDGAESV
jgi:hypothetical protein